MVGVLQLVRVESGCVLGTYGQVKIDEFVSKVPDVGASSLREDQYHE